MEYHGAIKASDGVDYGSSLAVVIRSSCTSSPLQRVQGVVAGLIKAPAQQQLSTIDTLVEAGAAPMFLLQFHQAGKQILCVHLGQWSYCSCHHTRDSIQSATSLAVKRRWSFS